MAALQTPDVTVGWKAAPFKLKGVDGKMHSLEDVKGPKGLLVMFICNHCPYVKAVIDRVVHDANELRNSGIGTVAIMSNDTKSYPDDSLENMQRFAAEKHFGFPYLIDETQAVARAYGAVCTPDFFGFNAGLELQYRGRLDESWQLIIPNPKRELLEAMREVTAKGSTNAPQFPSVGCSIKWREEKKWT
jgi:peroxiredoxin